MDALGSLKQAESGVSEPACEVWGPVCGVWKFKRKVWELIPTEFNPWTFV